jgi:hypothetical protein
MRRKVAFLILMRVPRRVRCYGITLMSISDSSVTVNPPPGRKF